MIDPRLLPLGRIGPCRRARFWRGFGRGGFSFISRRRNNGSGLSLDSVKRID